MESLLYIEDLYCVIFGYLDYDTISLLAQISKITNTNVIRRFGSNWYGNLTLNGQTKSSDLALGLTKTLSKVTKQNNLSLLVYFIEKHKISLQCVNEELYIETIAVNAYHREVVLYLWPRVCSHTQKVIAGTVGRKSQDTQLVRDLILMRKKILTRILYAALECCNKTILDTFLTYPITVYSYNFSTMIYLANRFPSCVKYWKILTKICPLDGVETCLDLIQHQSQVNLVEIMKCAINQDKCELVERLHLDLNVPLRLPRSSLRNYSNRLVLFLSDRINFTLDDVLLANNELLPRLVEAHGINPQQLLNQAVQHGLYGTALFIIENMEVDIYPNMVQDLAKVCTVTGFKLLISRGIHHNILIDFCGNDIQCYKYLLELNAICPAVELFQSQTLIDIALQNSIYTVEHLYKEALVTKSYFALLYLETLLVDLDKALRWYLASSTEYPSKMLYLAPSFRSIVTSYIRRRSRAICKLVNLPGIYLDELKALAKEYRHCSLLTAINVVQS